MMKKQILTAALALFGLTAFAGDSAPGVVQKQFTFQECYSLASEDAPTVPTGEYSNSTVDITLPESIDGNMSLTLHRELMDKTFGKEFHTWDEAVVQFLSELVTIDDTSVKYRKANPETVDGMSLYTKSVRLAGALRWGNYCSFEISHYLYLGGAHGSESQLYVNFDIKNDRIVKWQDLISNNAGAGRAIKNAIAKHLGYPSVAAMNREMKVSSSIVPTEFHADGRYVYVVFQPYELSGAYVHEVKVPKYALKPYMTAYGRSLLGVR